MVSTRVVSPGKRARPPFATSSSGDLNGLLAEPRRMKILDWLQEEGSARVRDLSAAFSVSEATIRQDVANGQLIHILPNCSTSVCDVEVCLFYSHRELLPARLRTFVDFCAEFFRAPGRPVAHAAIRISQPVNRDEDLETMS